VSRQLTYFGFDLETEMELLEDDIPDELRAQALDALADAVMSGETVHPDQARIRRSLIELDELWRRSGGTLPRASRAHLRELVRGQLESVASWSTFLGARLGIDPVELVDEQTRAALSELPSAARVKGDTIALEYDLEGGSPVVRLRLREGQARRLQPRDLPALDRALRFEVVRGGQPPLRASTLPGLQAELGRVSRRGPKERRHGRPGRSRR
jgi:hypothetical protein